MTTEIHGVQSIATGQFCTDCGVYLGRPSGHPEQCRKCATVTLQAERDAAVALLRDLTSHYTTHPHCGHDFTCGCKDADIQKARAFLKGVSNG